MAEETWTGWHFLQQDGRLRFSPHTPVEPGQTLTASGHLCLRQNGMHASRRAIDALHYAPGPIVCRVTLIGERLDGKDKSCARSRKCLWMADATRTLHEFALQCAEQALTRANATDKRLWHAISVKRLWLDGRATDAELFAARAAAYAAADSYAYAAYAAAAYSYAAAANAAAASAAANVAANVAGSGGTTEDQNQRLEAMLLALEPSKQTGEPA